MALTPKEVIEAINKAMKTEVTQIGTEHLLSDVPYFISTSSTLLDLALGGGIAGRRIVELYASESEGKSTIATHILANVQKAGGLAMLIDSETTIERSRSERIGLDMSQVIMNYASTVEDGFDSIRVLLEKIAASPKRAEDPTQPVVIVWDTIAAVPTIAEKEKGKFGGGQAERPRIIRGGLRLISMPLAKANAVLILNNHLISSLNPYSPVTTPGGTGPKLFATHRIWLKRSGLWKDPVTDVEKGIIVRAKIMKNKLGPPLKEPEIVIMFENGIDDNWSLFTYASDDEVKIIERGGAWYSFNFPDEKGNIITKKFHQKDFPKLCIDHPGLIPQLKKRVTDYWNGNGV